MSSPGAAHALVHSVRRNRHIVRPTLDNASRCPHSTQEVSMSAQRKPSIVFVHGLWADGSCFSKLIPTLQNEGFEVIASQHGLDSHAGDVDCVKRTLGRVSSPAILVGHS